MQMPAAGAASPSAAGLFSGSVSARRWFAVRARPTQPIGQSIIAELQVRYVDYDPSRRCSDQGGKPDYCHPNAFPGTTIKLFRNRGPVPGTKANVVRFEDVTLKAGLGRRVGTGLGVICADFNGDRWPDIFIADDAQPNQLWIN
jgi:hypothetical protein